ncbi:uncharacterized protein BDW47DRAFT_124101 [Aspergillus candidus]|uniref:Uncharacterized protein n=1 Tax=Aspergillus candidus TaxID=41067 RepID=A0A2I2FGK5_ASPCN|nr:hypothetical protein BDW47DRAFT_124101 [Aspergillus candidus]PLB39765.1 hypothetical protein BDW47DRAFT_124101 [Aspergillus candidus]
MSPKKTWFLPPDFTFLENGHLKLGTVLAHPKDPTRVLLHSDSISAITPSICLPSTQVLVEPNHGHIDSGSTSVGGKLWANFVQLASASISLDLEWRKSVEYGAVDHEVHVFNREFTNDALSAIVAQPDVKSFIDSGLWGKRRIYIVSGLRITTTSMKVMTGRGTARGVGVGGSAPIGGLPVEVGVDLHQGIARDKMDSYETDQRVIFAYRLSVIKPKKKGGAEPGILFSHRTAFMNGGVDDEKVEMEVADIDMQELRDDPGEEGFNFVEHAVGDDDVLITLG